MRQTQKPGGEWKERGVCFERERGENRECDTIELRDGGMGDGG